MSCHFYYSLVGSFNNSILFRSCRKDKFLLGFVLMQYRWKCLLVNSLPIWHLRTFGIPWSALKFWNYYGTSLLARKYFMTFNLLYLSLITSTYLNPWTLGGLKGPNMSINIFPRCSVLLTSVFLEIDCFVILNKAKISQISLAPCKNLGNFDISKI